MSPYVAIAAGAQVASGVAGFKGNRAAARAARQQAEYNYQLTQNERVLLARQKRESEARIRQRGEMQYGMAATAIAKSGVQFAGSSLKALSDITHAIAKDAAFVQYAASIEDAKKAAEGEQVLFQGAVRSSAYKAAATGSLLGGVTGAASTYASLN